MSAEEVFIQRIKEEREKKNLNMKEVAIQIGLAPDTYRKYENGKRLPDYTTLVKLSMFFDVSIDYLLGKYNKSLIQ